MKYAPDTLTPGGLWRREAACRDRGDDMFPDNNAALIERARRICSGCPVIEQCFEDTMRAEGGRSKETRWGVYAGLTPAQRHHLYRKQPGRWSDGTTKAA